LDFWFENTPSGNPAPQMDASDGLQDQKLFIFFSSSSAAAFEGKVTRLSCGKIAQNVAQPIFCQSYLYFKRKKHHILGYFCNFYKTSQAQRSPIWRKFAQSGTDVMIF
jgi:hypothetical protein